MYIIDPCDKFYSLNKSLVESEINFNRTVLFSSEINLSEIEKIRSQYDSEEKPSYTAFVAKAISLAIQEYPYANRRLFHPFGLPFLSFFQTFKSADIAIAIERNIQNYNAVAYIEILRNPHLSELKTIHQSLKGFSNSTLNTSSQWRSFHRLGRFNFLGLGGLIAHLPFYSPSLWEKYRGGAVMISSPAKYGVDGVVAAWTHPLSFSFGLVQLKPMISNGQVVAAPGFTFVMNWDRRVMAGAQAARFFNKICELLRHPAELTGLSISK